MTFVIARAQNLAPSGALTGATFGAFNSGFPGITVSNSYNSRLQPSVISATSPTATVLSLSYNFNQGAVPNLMNNGDVVDIANNRDNSRSQHFTYDALNRILQAYTPNSTKWGEAFTIDPWGNLWKRDPIAGKTGYENLNAPASVQNQLSGTGPDAAGNTTTDALGHLNAYSYDEENRLLTAGGMTYVYDGDGNRVKKYGGSTGTLYWPGRDNEILNESDLTATN